MLKKKQNKRDNPSFARKVREQTIYPSKQKGCFGGKKTMSKLKRKFLRNGRLI